MSHEKNEFVRDVIIIYLLLSLTEHYSYVDFHSFNIFSLNWILEALPTFYLILLAFASTTLHIPNAHIWEILYFFWSCYSSDLHIRVQNKELY